MLNSSKGVAHEFSYGAGVSREEETSLPAVLDDSGGAMPLELERRDIQPSAALITLNGRLLLGQESASLAALVPELIASGRKNLIFDLRGVTHIDSTGIGRFIDAYTRLAKIGGKMRLAGATGSVRDSFHVTRLDTVFAFYPTVEAACQGLS
jgi:anti-sigma B factor antagonist